MGGPIQLLTDRYQLTMLAAHARSGLANRRATFELFARRLPKERRYMVACGIGRALEAIKDFQFGERELSYLKNDPVLGPALKEPKVLEVFENLRFNGEIWAIPEGRICYPGEPLVRVESSLAEAQILETYLLSVINHDTRVASKCARISTAASGRPCFEFGSRRTHEWAAVSAARAAYIGGFAGTSNDEAALRYDIPVVGTMAHAYLLAHAADGGEACEEDAFNTFCDTYEQESVCLIDTFDTLRGVDRALKARGAKLGGVRIDSGDLSELAKGCRERLDGAGAREAKIILSDDLNEYKITKLLANKTPVDGFGVGTMAVATPDAPTLGAVYKLVEMHNQKGDPVAVQKRAPGKGSSAAAKQVFRNEESFEDMLALAGESHPGTALLEKVYAGGEVLADTSAKAARGRFLADLAAMPRSARSILPRQEDEAFPVTVSAQLKAIHQMVATSGRAAVPSH